MKFFGGLIFVWMLWASLSEGGLYELRQINPEYAHPDKSVTFLISKLGYSESNGLYDSHHVEQCSFYMPNWAKAKRCFRVRKSCEAKMPIKEQYVGMDVPDIFSDKYDDCWNKNHPFRGPYWWLRFSRGLFRGGVSLGLTWVTGGFGGKGEKQTKWEEENESWTMPVMEWLREGQ